MVLRGQWQLYKYADDTPPVLFDLETDPQQLQDRACGPALSDLCRQLLDDLFQGWGPDFVFRDCEQQTAEMKLLAAWGAAVDPAHEDTLPVPEGAEQIELQ